MEWIATQTLRISVDNLNLGNSTTYKISNRRQGSISID